MSFEFQIFHDRRLAYKRVTGIYGDEDAQAAILEWRRLVAEEGVSEYDEFHDLTWVTQYEVSIDGIRAMALSSRRSRLERNEIPKRVAYVVPSDLGYGTGRIYSAMIDVAGEDFKVFRNLAEATFWLEIPADSLDFLD